MKFQCSGCGACCRRIKDAVAHSAHITALKFPYNWDESGKCEMLLEDNTCMVYENRPLLCNVEKVAELMGYDKEEFYKQNYRACLTMQDIDQVDDKYRLKIN